jgi:EAL domain-containing protein (putative c-di-GMP-specific phosphodiesterase class I)
MAGISDPADTRTPQLLRTLVELAHIYRLTVTAESVENTAQLRRLQEAGCDDGQGWLFAPAQPPDLIPSFVHAPPWTST